MTRGQKTSEINDKLLEDSFFYCVARFRDTKTGDYPGILVNMFNNGKVSAGQERTEDCGRLAGFWDQWEWDPGGGVG